MNERYIFGPVIKRNYGGKDVLYILLTLLQLRGQWEKAARIFTLKGVMFDKMMTIFIDLLSYPLFETVVERKWFFFPFFKTIQSLSTTLLLCTLLMSLSTKRICRVEICRNRSFIVAVSTSLTG